jgi:large subunit ribosomal protein L28
MSQACEVCGRKPSTGNQVTIRGKAKYLGGVGTKITGISRRTFKPNLQTVHITEKGTNKTARVCTRCIRSGAITKRVRAKPFHLPPSAKGQLASAPAAKTAPAKASTKKAPSTKAAK